MFSSPVSNLDRQMNTIHRTAVAGLSAAGAGWLLLVGGNYPLRGRIRSGGASALAAIAATSAATLIAERLVDGIYQLVLPALIANEPQHLRRLRIVD